jgi:hypothetical protein
LDESPDMLSNAYDLADPKLVFGVNGDISEAAGEGDEGTSRAVFREQTEVETIYVYLQIEVYFSR